MKALLPFRDPIQLREMTMRLVGRALEHYLAINPETTQNRDEMKITLLVAWSFESSRPDFVCHVNKVLDLIDGSCCVEVRGSPRRNAEAKDSQWVR